MKPHYSMLQNILRFGTSHEVWKLVFGVLNAKNLCVCRACLLLVRIKLFYLKFFKGLSCLFLLKLVDLSQICFLALLLSIGNFCCWANILGLYIFFRF